MAMVAMEAIGRLACWVEGMATAVEGTGQRMERMTLSSSGRPR